MTISHDRSRSSLSAIERPLLDADEERALIVRARQGDARARTELVGAHLRLVRAVTRRIAGATSEDALAEGVVGLLEAIERFDDARGSRLGTYAAHWIRARVQRFVLANRGIVHAPDTRACRKVYGRIARARRALSTHSADPSAAELARVIGVEPSDVETVLTTRTGDVPIDTAHEAGIGPTAVCSGPEETYGDAELARARMLAVHRALAVLPERERRVVQARALADEVQTLDQLARQLQLSRERVRQLEARALRCIGEALTAEGLAA